ncbi:MAG: PPC domain-containing DNA-binding protein [Hyphomicrobiaceae bacterium]
MQEKTAAQPIEADDVVGKVESIVFSRLKPSADLYHEIKRICDENDIQAGVIMSITGALERAKLQLLSTELSKDGHPVVVDFEGPFECSGHGIIGRFRQSNSGGIFAKDLANSPYLHVHLTITVGAHDGTKTVCGHLVEGCTVLSPHHVSHFTIAIAKVSGVRLELVSDKSFVTPGFAEGHRFHSLGPA